jgi:hypothetical protein
MAMLYESYHLTGPREYLSELEGKNPMLVIHVTQLVSERIEMVI